MLRVNNISDASGLAFKCTLEASVGFKIALKTGVKKDEKLEDADWSGSWLETMASQYISRPKHE